MESLALENIEKLGLQELNSCESSEIDGGMIFGINWGAVSSSFWKGAGIGIGVGTAGAAAYYGLSAS